MVSVCVVNWRTANETIKLAASLEAGAGGLPFELCVVDNDSGDGSVERIGEAVPWAIVVRMGRNAGFGSGINRAVAEARGEYLFILNPDTTVSAGAIHRLVEFLDASPEVALAAPLMVDAHGTRHASARRFPTVGAAIFRNTFMGRLFPGNRYTHEYLMDDLATDRPTEVDWVSGSAMMIRRSDFEAVGGFDEGFFMYCEDIDLCKRLWGSGRKVVFVPDARVEHKIGASSDKVQGPMILAHHRSMLRYYRKHIAPTVPAALRPLYPAGVWVRYALRQSYRRWLEMRERMSGARRAQA